MVVGGTGVNVSLPWYPGAPNAEIEPMFGNLGACVNDMFMGLFGSDVGMTMRAGRNTGTHASGVRGFCM